MTDTVIDKEQCLRLLRGSSDEEKFVGLFLLVRCGNDEQLLLAAWRALRATFLIRMLKTDGGKHLRTMGRSFVLHTCYMLNAGTFSPRALLASHSVRWRA